jgi:hypothetical protein
MRDLIAASYLLVCLLGLPFDSEDGSSTFLLNVGKLLPDFVPSHHTRLILFDCFQFETKTRTSNKYRLICSTAHHKKCCLFVYSLFNDAVSHPGYRPVVSNERMIVNNELDMMWKEATVVYAGICLEGLRKTMKHLRIVCVTAGIRAGYLLNTSKKRYHVRQLARIFTSIIEQRLGSRCSDWLRAGRWRDRSSSPGRVKNFPCRPDRFWGPPNLLSSGYRWRFSPY